MCAVRMIVTFVVIIDVANGLLLYIHFCWSVHFKRTLEAVVFLSCITSFVFKTKEAWKTFVQLFCEALVQVANNGAVREGVENQYGTVKEHSSLSLPLTSENMAIDLWSGCMRRYEGQVDDSLWQGPWYSDICMAHACVHCNKHFIDMQLIPKEVNASYWGLSDLNMYQPPQNPL